jgi:glutaredoxin 3
MARVEIYTTPSCPYCVQAKRLLTARGVPYQEIDIAEDDELREEVIRRSGRRTVPQIFIDGDSVGGYEELAALDARGDLARLAPPRV